MEDKRVSIKDVAKKANVSIATVSRVVNHIEGVKPEMQQKVMAAINELGYSPNTAARSQIIVLIHLSEDFQKLKRMRNHIVYCVMNIQRQCSLEEY